MIALSRDCLLIRFQNGESTPYCADMISTASLGITAKSFDPDFIQHVANGVFYYFKSELGRHTVEFGEFVVAMEKALSGFKPFEISVEQPILQASAGLDLAEGPVVEADLRRLAGESGDGGELFFFPRLRDELRHGMRQTPRVMRFTGLRRCVKHLTGAQRWGQRCRTLEDQIIAFMRECLQNEQCSDGLALMVE